MTRRLTKIFKVCLVTCVAACATSCDVHEFGDKFIDTDDSQVQVGTDITLSLDFNTIMPLHREIIYTRGASQSELFDAYYHVELYRMNSKGSYDEDPDISINYVNSDISNLNHDLHLRLQDGTYRVVAWTHYVDEGEIFKHFELDNLKFASISDYKAYNGNTNMADAYRAVNYIEIKNDDSATHHHKVEMSRPVAKFEVYATDIDAFLEMMAKKQKPVTRAELNSGKYTAKIIYNGYVGSMYNIISDYVADARPNLYFSGPITMLDEQEARLAFDYVFVNNYGGTVTISMEICDDTGECVASVKNVEVPLMQGYLTILRGEFMSSKTNGVGISSDFIGPDYNIRF